MVRVAGPAMSMQASGKLGGALVFSTWKGRPYARALVTPSNPKSTSQVAMRAMLKFLSQDWTNLSPTAKASWAAAAAIDNVSTFNAYCRFNMRRWRQYNTPIANSYISGFLDTRTVTQTLTGGIRNVLIGLTPSADTDEWGIIIFRSAGAITTPNWNKAVAIIKSDSTNQMLYTDSPLVAGTYHYRAATFNDQGDIGVVVADATAVAT